MLSKNDLSIPGIYPVFSSETTNNGIIGKTNFAPEFIVNEHKPYYVTFGDHTRSFNIAKESFSVADNVKVLLPIERISLNAILFIVSTWKKCIINKGYARHWSIAKNVKFKLPQKNGEIDYEFMESFIAELEAERIAELEAYLNVTGLKDYELTESERKALDSYHNLNWGEYNLEKLFGKSTRGKRMKSEDRIAGNLPFVTAGETNEGISAFIGNDVTVFSKNTTTIDMFGSAKYRSYDYGGDDHVAVVHTENLPTKTAIFLTSAIHKASHTGKFDYGHNFYAKDADELNVMLPMKDNTPDYAIMELIISAVQKLVIKDVVLYADRKIKATREVVGKPSGSRIHKRGVRLWTV